MIGELSGTGSRVLDTVCAGRLSAKMLFFIHVSSWEPLCVYVDGAISSSISCFGVFHAGKALTDTSEDVR